uniref:Ankyrin repeat protein n=1 Tax=Colletotrichum fructicola (strain Nara gc5) TaxID=1213859 RepID=L2FHN8_COLFN
MSRTATYHRALFEPILYARDATRGLSVLWAAARGDQAALRKAIRHGVTVNAKWPRKWRSPWKTTCHPKWRFDEKLKGYTALHVAAVFGRTDAAAILSSAPAPAPTNSPPSAGGAISRRPTLCMTSRHEPRQEPRCTSRSVTQTTMLPKSSFDTARGSRWTGPTFATGLPSTT